VFGDRVAALDARADFAQAPPTTTAEVYLVAGRDDVNVKVRGGLLDVKRRLRVERGLELWSPVLKAAFPIGAEVVAALFQQWRMPAPPLSRERYLLDQCLDEVIARTTGVRILHVRKTRRQTRLDGCVVERASLDVDGRTLQTAAVESEHPDQVLQLARSLGLAAEDNVSYVAALRRLPPAGGHTAAPEALEEGAIP
jgi:exopolyphosphatase/guanosine-5'-triphosphate,3'-diphosphate pyrophosphatase